MRLKGGDPFVFGRGGEEAEALRDADIDFEIVPGITAGVAAPAYAGIPVTHRDAASAVAFVTGHEDPTKPESALDWAALADFPGTLVVYMGVRQLPGITERLIAGGRRRHRARCAGPARHAARPARGRRHARRRSPTSAARPGSRRRRSPCSARSPRWVPVSSWYRRPPLTGQRIAVTRARAQASGLAARLRALGASVVETPAIKIVPLDGPPPELGAYDLVCLTSPNGVRLLFDRLAAAGRDARAFAGATVAAIGPGTAPALAERGITADVVPEKFVAEGLIEALEDVPVERVLIARAAEARDVLPDALRERGAQVDVVALYETVAEDLSETELAAVAAADYVTFTSSSTVRFFLDTAGDDLQSRTRLVSIGPVTSETLRERGLQPHVEAGRHDIDGLVEALLADVAAD